MARSLDTTPHSLGRNKTNIYFKLYSHGVNKYRLENMKHKKHNITQYLMVLSTLWSTMRAGYKMVPVSSLKKCPVFNATTSGSVHRIDQGCSLGGGRGSEYHWHILSFIKPLSSLLMAVCIYERVKITRMHQYHMWQCAVWPRWWWWWWTDQDSLIAKADHSRVLRVSTILLCTDHTRH